MKDTGLAGGMIFEVFFFVFILLVVWRVGALVCVCVFLGLDPLCPLVLYVFVGFLNVLDSSGFSGFVFLGLGVCVVVFLEFCVFGVCVDLGLPFRAANTGNHAYHE